jgi:very-short-patch-repair endonuclease
MSWLHRPDQRPRTGEEAFQSNAEEDLFKYIQAHAPHLLTGLRTQEPVPLGTDGGTVPDFLWSCPQPEEVAVYLDGVEVHKDLRKDQRIYFAMKRHGYRVLRWRYSGRLSQASMSEIVSWVEDKMREARERRAQSQTRRGDEEA